MLIRCLGDSHLNKTKIQINLKQQIQHIITVLDLSTRFQHLKSKKTKDSIILKSSMNMTFQWGKPWLWNESWKNLTEATKENNPIRISQTHHLLLKIFSCVLPQFQPSLVIWMGLKHSKVEQDLRAFINSQETAVNKKDTWWVLSHKISIFKRNLSLHAEQWLE
jgi:hypothetical protein